MLVDRILGNIRQCSYPDKLEDIVYIEWFELEKKLLRKTSELGTEVSIRLEGHLHDGDILLEDPEKRIVIEVLPTELIVTPVESMTEMGYLCFKLGNRHLPLKIKEDKVITPYDEPTYLYLVKQGYVSKRVVAKFTHYTVCHSHSQIDMED